MQRYNLEFRYGTSRGRDTYGYNIVSLKVNGHKVASTCGGGYCMQGAVVGEWIQNCFQLELLALAQRLPKNGEVGPQNPCYWPAYGLHLDGRKKVTRAIVDGSHGIETMRKLLNELGYEMHYVTRDVRIVEAVQS